MSEFVEEIEEKEPEYISKTYDVSKKKRSYNKKYDYSYRIFFAVRAGSEREKALIELAQEYKTDINAGLIDKILDDKAELIMAHKLKLADIARREAEIAEDKRQVYGG